jgi:hypothetical protein
LADTIKEYLFSTTPTPSESAPTEYFAPDESIEKYLFGTEPTQPGILPEIEWGHIIGSLANQTDLQTALDVKVNLIRTINSHPLSADVVLTKTDIGLGNVPNIDCSTSANIIDYTDKRFVTDLDLVKLSNTTGVNTGDETLTSIKTKLGITTLSGSNTGDQDLSAYVPTSRQINGKALIANITLTPADIGAQPSGSYEPTLTKGNLTESGSTVLTITGGANAVIGSGTTINVKQASGTQNGYLLSTDWTIFNSKQAALGYTSENSANKVVAFSSPTDVQYPSAKLVSDQLSLKVASNIVITPGVHTKITYDAKGLVTAGVDATTADIADSLDKRYITDAQKTSLASLSGINTGDETQATIKSKLGAASASLDGYLTSTDWNVFNSKQPAGSYQTAHANLTSLSALSFASVSFVKMTATGTFALDTTVLGSAATYAYTAFDVSGAASAVQSNLTTHIGLTGTSVHGLGTASTHAATDFQAAGSYQTLSSNLTSLAALSYSATAFVKMTSANTFALDTATYEPSLTKGNLTATSPIALDQTRQVIGGAAVISIADATTSVKGAVQLSNSYSGTSQVLAVTEKALSDGLATGSDTLTDSITAGNGQGAVSLTSNINIITMCATSNYGVTLPAAFALNYKIRVINNGVKIATVYPASGDTIDSLSTNAPIYIVPGGTVELRGTTANATWKMVEGKIQQSQIFNPTVSYSSGGTNWTTTRAIAYVRLEALTAALFLEDLKIIGAFGSSTASGNGVIAITGVVFKNVSGNYVPLFGDNSGGTWMTGSPDPNANTITIWSGGNYTGVRLAGSLELESQTIF